MLKLLQDLDFIIISPEQYVSSRGSLKTVKTLAPLGCIETGTWLLATFRSTSQVSACPRRIVAIATSLVHLIR
jgi:hypothetical protein